MTILLRGGHVIDPDQDLDRDLDVLIDGGKIAGLIDPAEQNLVPLSDVEVHDLHGAIVTPGLIDLHGHWYEGSSYGVDPQISLRSGVTVAVDAGTTGFVAFHWFRRHTIDPAPLRVFGFVNIAALGISTNLSGELEDGRHLRPAETIETIEAHRDVAVGVKIRLGGGRSSQPAKALDLAIEAARGAGVPLMVDIGHEDDLMPLALTRLDRGDILTHCFTSHGATIIDRSGRVREEAREARRRGVSFDVGHGRGSFSWRSAHAAVDGDFPPDSLSTDLHRFSVHATAPDLLSVMAKFLHLRYPLTDIVRWVTVGPAAAIGLQDPPSLRTGRRADLAGFRVAETDETAADTVGISERIRVRLDPVLTVVDGRPIEPSSVSIRLRPPFASESSYA
jgi:dihydroorotase